MDELKETEPKFRFTTMNGYMILDRHYHDDGRLDILAVRQFNHGDNCYYVGRDYDVADGQCVSGLFAYSFDEAQSAWDKARGFDYEMVMITNEPKIYSLHTEWEDYEIALEVNAYAYGGNLAVMMNNRDTDFPGMYEPYGNATVNVGECEFLESAVDVNNLGPEIVDWLEENGIAERTGKSMGSGFVEYPVMRFNEDLLREISPDGFATYEKAQLEHIYLDGMAGEYPELVAKLEKDLGIGEERKPSELKAAGEKPKAAACEAATPDADGRVCSASAAARAGEGPAHEVKRQR